MKKISIIILIIICSTMVNSSVNIEPQRNFLKSTLNMNNNSIINIGELVAAGGLGYLTFGSKINISNTDSAITLYNNATTVVDEGVPVFSIESGTIDDPRVHLSIVKQKNLSGRYLGNSWIIAPEKVKTIGTTDATNFTNCQYICDFFNKTCKVDCDTGGSGADLLVQDDIEALGELFANDGIEVEGRSSFIGNGIDDFDISEQDVHIIGISQKIEVLQPGQEFSQFYNFDGRSTGSLANITPWQRETLNSAGREWTFNNGNGFCVEDPCFVAKGGNVNQLRIMNLSAPSTNAFNITIDFFMSQNLMDIEENERFYITINNNEGSGEVKVFEQNGTGVNIINQFVKINLSSTFENVTLNTLRFYHQASQQTEKTYFDNFNVTGVLGTPTLFNTTVYNSKLEFSNSGTTCDIRVNDSGIDRTFYIGEGCNDLRLSPDSGNVFIDGNLTVTGNIDVSGCINYNGGTLGSCI